MNEILGLFTAMGIMVAGAQGPCQKQVSARIEKLLIHDEHGRIGEDIRVQQSERSPGLFEYRYIVRRANGSEKIHTYSVHSDRDCENIQIHRG